MENEAVELIKQLLATTEETLKNSTVLSGKKTKQLTIKWHSFNSGTNNFPKYKIYPDIEITFDSGCM